MSSEGAILQRPRGGSEAGVSVLNARSLWRHAGDASSGRELHLLRGAGVALVRAHGGAGGRGLHAEALVREGDEAQGVAVVGGPPRVRDARRGDDEPGVVVVLDVGHARGEVDHDLAVDLLGAAAGRGDRRHDVVGVGDEPTHAEDVVAVDLHALPGLERVDAVPLEHRDALVQQPAAAAVPADEQVLGRHVAQHHDVVEGDRDVVLEEHRRVGVADEAHVGDLLLRVDVVARARREELADALDERGVELVGARAEAQVLAAVAGGEERGDRHHAGDLAADLAQVDHGHLVARLELLVEHGDDEGRVAVDLREGAGDQRVTGDVLVHRGVRGELGHLREADGDEDEPTRELAVAVLVEPGLGLHGIRCSCDDLNGTLGTSARTTRPDSLHTAYEQACECE